MSAADDMTKTPPEPKPVKRRSLVGHVGRVCGWLIGGLLLLVIVLVGETPGDQEDRQGKPFVGPAGWVLDEALIEAGLNRGEVYVTNAVKHFKWEPRGKRRLHKKPSAREMAACRPWLEAELHVLKPKVIVCLGATAAQALLGRAFRVSRQRGQRVMGPDGIDAIATHHPSAVLRAPDQAVRHRMRQELAADLSIAASLLGQND